MAALVIALSRRGESGIVFAEVLAKSRLRLGKVFVILGKLRQFYRQICTYPNRFGKFRTCPNLRGNTDYEQ